MKNTTQKLASEIEKKMEALHGEYSDKINKIINKDVFELAEKNENDYKLAYYLAKVFQDVLQYRTLNFLENIVLNSKNAEYNMLYAENISNNKFEAHKMIVRNSSYFDFLKMLKKNYNLKEEEALEIVNKYFEYQMENEKLPLYVEEDIEIF